MKAKYLLTIGVITLAGCWGWEGSNPLPETEQESAITAVLPEPLANNEIASLPNVEPIVIPALPPIEPISQPPPITPITPPETGAASIDIAQLEQHPRHYRGPRFQQPVPVIISVLGKNTDNTLSIQIPKPPKELHACNQSIILGEYIPIIDEKYRYNNWWLIASTTALANHDSNIPVYFLWARKISETEVGAVATGTGTSLINIKDPTDTKINTGYTTIPYQWVSRLENYNYFPMIADESCAGIK